MDEEEIHIAVGKNFRKEKANILWAAARFARATIVLVHVHWPSKWMPFMGSKVLYKFADEKEKEMHRTKETDAMVKMLSRYKNLCGTRKVRVHYLSHDDVLAGVVNLIKKLKIKRIVIGSRSMSKEAMLLKCCQVWVVINGKHMSTSNDHLEHTGSIGYGGSPESLASIHELSDDSNGYITPPSDFADEIIYDDGITQMDGTDELAMEAEAEEEEIIETGEQISYEEVEQFPQEIAHQTDEIQSFRSVSERAEELMEEIDKLQRKLKELQEEDHGILSPRQKLGAASSLKKEKSLSTPPRYPELQLPEHIARLSMAKISEATENFNSRNLIGEGGYGPVYRGKLGGVAVAIKLLRPHPHGGKQGFPEYKQEVMVLSRVKHPHIVKLMGVCPETCCLVYEHLPNGSLLDSLAKRPKPQPLSWKDRVRILAEQRSALAYLHSCRPHAIIHADLKLTNILLDAANGSRLGDFGTARTVHVKPLQDEEDTICRRTNPMGTTGYMDPLFFITGELTAESDVYAFGVVILQVLTGLPHVNIAEQVREAIRMDAVHCVLDASAGSWPEVQADKLLRLALRCCSLERKRRPAITCDAEWRSLDILQRMAKAQTKSWKRTPHGCGS
ncbi:U-box domain-containing protein 33-like isoform X2 [Oryza brachyantha]|uniref:U-box domain-containing protein 33-like isoform X2 n=1 Tax=Oryza brachyantha TaxID=4533 RepID=UPI0003EA9217|nr:U-box domain-containing protein 33-like isoform X2 [Oryza brachyantha]